jgi:putative ubiquitin-RnfH superfamily antitoxin RatB of RatAB toxin-antitoxin module
VSSENSKQQHILSDPAHDANQEIAVEVAYARPDVQVIIPVQVRQGATLEDAIRQSGILDTFAEINLAVNKVSVFGKLSKLTVGLRSGDRVEINRPLIADPKQARKQRAEQDSKKFSMTGKAEV